MKKNHQQKENTTYIDGFAVLFFDGMSKERKKYKRDSAICEGLENYKKNTKIQIAFLDVMEKYEKNTKCIFLYFICIFCFLFLQTKYKKYELNCSKIRNTKKHTNQQFQKYKIQKNTNSKFQKYKIQRKDKFKNKPESQPRVHYGNQETNCKKKCKTNQLYFPNPAVLILYFWVVFFICFLYF